MKSLTVVIDRNPSVDAVASLVKEVPGGYWSESEPCEGGIDGPNGVVYVSYDGGYRRYWREELDDDQDRVLTSLGHEPDVAVHLHLSSRGDSAGLARDLSDRLIAAWGGLVIA